MFKITTQGKTMVCNNEDAWNPEVRLWFEKGEKGSYGAMFLGFNDLFPQGGMNEHGLCFDGFTVPNREIKASGKQLPANPWVFGKQVMHTCKTVEEVKTCFDKIDHSYLNGAMLLYVDRNGNYLVVECDTTILGNDPAYILSNFCPSQTKNLNEVKINRYRKGMQFLSVSTPESNLDFCRTMMDTMHVCRSGLGDGTLYTNIFDTEKGKMYLYFYHDYTNSIAFDLKSELTKGNHIIAIPTLFPSNSEYEQLKKYKTAVTSKGVFWTVAVCGGLFLFSAIYLFCALLVNLFRKSNSNESPLNWLRAGLFFVNVLMMNCLFFVLRDKGIAYLGFYPEVPWLSLYKLASFTPWIALATLIVILFSSKMILKKSAWNLFSKFAFALNATAFFACVLLFTYWGLYKLF